jgi:hypothetical protein
MGHRRRSAPGTDALQQADRVEWHDLPRSRGPPCQLSGAPKARHSKSPSQARPSKGAQPNATPLAGAGARHWRMREREHGARDARPFLTDLAGSSSAVDRALAHVRRTRLRVAAGEARAADQGYLGGLGQFCDKNRCDIGKSQPEWTGGGPQRCLFRTSTGARCTTRKSQPARLRHLEGQGHRGERQHAPPILQEDGRRRRELASQPEVRLRRDLPGAFPSSIFRDKNRGDIGKSQSKWTSSKMERPRSRWSGRCRWAEGRPAPPPRPASTRRAWPSRSPRTQGPCPASSQSSASSRRNRGASADRASPARPPPSTPHRCFSTLEPAACGGRVRDHRHDLSMLSNLICIHVARSMHGRCQARRGRRRRSTACRRSRCTPSL